MTKLYSPLIAIIDKTKNDFKEKASSEGFAAEIHGDDEENENNCYQKIEIPVDPSEYDKEEIKALKQTITDLGKNILAVVNNPISKFHEEDIRLMRDYIDTVNIWLWTTSATTSIEFVAKMNEINKMTEEMMKNMMRNLFLKRMITSQLGMNFS